MKKSTPSLLLEYTTQALGMTLQEDTLCGKHFVGDTITTTGSLWYYAHEDYFAVTKCNFTFCKDCTLHMPFASLYMAIRLDSANHLHPKIISFMEEKGGPVSSTMKKGSRVTYTEIMYFPVFYRKHLDVCFPLSIEDPVKLLKTMGGDHNYPSEMLQILEDIQQYDSTNPSASLYYVGKSYELMASLLTMGSSRAPRNAADYHQLLRVITYINEHLNIDIKQKDLVKIANMSPTKLKTLFKQFTGLSISHYISEKKIDKASHLLADTHLSIEEIALQSGFETPSGFTTFFKKHTQLSPTAYRRQMKFFCLENPSDQGILKFPEFVQYKNPVDH